MTGSPCGTDAEIAQVRGGALVLPMTANEIVLAYNLPGVPELRLSRELYPLIFAGQVERWNDPRIAATNPGVTLPDCARRCCIPIAHGFPAFRQRFPEYQQPLTDN